jgi:hypothetical protein
MVKLETLSPCQISAPPQGFQGHPCTSAPLTPLTPSTFGMVFDSRNPTSLLNVRRTEDLYKTVGCFKNSEWSLKSTDGLKRDAAVMAIVNSSIHIEVGIRDAGNKYGWAAQFSYFSKRSGTATGSGVSCVPPQWIVSIPTACCTDNIAILHLNVDQENPILAHIEQPNWGFKKGGLSVLCHANPPGHWGGNIEYHGSFAQVCT